MSRYHEIRAAWMSSRDLQLENRDACFCFIERFTGGLIEFLDIPADFVRLSPLDATSVHDEPTVSDASLLDARGYWCTGLSISIAKDLPRTPSLDARLVLHLKKRGDAFLLKLYEDGDVIRVPARAGGDLSPAYEFVFHEILRWLGPSD